MPVAPIRGEPVSAVRAAARAARSGAAAPLAGAQPMPAGRAPRIAFAGTPEFAVPTLDAIVALGADVPLVLTQPDRPAGRGRRLTPPPVKRAAAARGLRVEQPLWLGDQAVLADWERGGGAPDLLVVVAYGLLLPAWLLRWPVHGCVNVHASLLPRWRGAAPIQHAILAGDSETGVSLMRMDQGLDTGAVYAMRRTPIGEGETAGALHDRLAVLGAALAAETLPRVLDGSLAAAPQDHSAATYAPKIDKRAARLDWRRPADELALTVRAYHPWPIAFAELSDGRVLRVHAADALPAPGGAAQRPTTQAPPQPSNGAADSSPRAARGVSPGTIVAAGRNGIDVAAGRGVLRLTRVQPPSSRAMDAAAYLAAHRLEGLSFV